MLTPDGTPVSSFDLDFVRGITEGAIFLSSQQPASEPRRNHLPSCELPEHFSQVFLIA